MLEEQVGLLIPASVICVQMPATKNDKTKLLFLDAVSVYFHSGIPKPQASVFNKV